MMKTKESKLSNMDYMKIMIGRKTKEGDFDAVIDWAKAAGEESRRKARSCKMFQSIYTALFLS